MCSRHTHTNSRHTKTHPQITHNPQWATALRSSRQRVIQLPPNTDFFTMVGEVVDANEDLEALAEATEGVGGVVMVYDGLLRM